MIYQHQDQKLGGQLHLSLGENTFDWNRSKSSNHIHIIWNPSKQAVILDIDGQPTALAPQHLLTASYFHHIEMKTSVDLLNIISFNREFYCIHDHDHEVSCNGILFFGAEKNVIVRLDETNQTRLNVLMAVFKDEFTHADKIHGEMLVMLLKRLIIILTRIAKKQIGLNDDHDDKTDTVRLFNYLVDKHFREHKTVKAYADLLNKSPKTLSNLFSMASNKSPLQLIHERIVLEGRRLLSYTDQNVNEIAFDLGFDEPAPFHKLFKRVMKMSPLQFRENLKT